MIDRLSSAYGRLLAGLALAGCAILLAMMLIIVVDVLLRNLAVPGLPRGLAWSNEISELMLYLITMCVAPWLLRRGQHIRVDIVLRAIPPRVAWLLEWVGDAI
ncbi:MAG TPA: TRAP transporter small permease subunit, partial [Burkholderiaceae bacterium]|nr:TRAP transporter small permease subunit [Burkholderiaceae bacterium]